MWTTETKTDASLLMCLLTERKRSSAFFMAWMIQEEGRNTQMGEENGVETNNPCNISGPIDHAYTWFTGANRVLSNNVVIYDRADQGCYSTVELVRHFFPKVLTAATDEEALLALGEPDINGEHWASDPHYGEELVAVYQGLVQQSKTVKAGTLARSFYTVEANDTLTTIALRLHKTVQELRTMNPQIANPNIIDVGEKVYY